MPEIMAKDGIRGSDRLHGWWGLSYASYLVMPRSVLQSLPETLQAKWADLLEETQECVWAHDFDWPPEECSIEVRLRNQDGRYVEDPLMDYERGRRRLWINDEDKPDHA